MRREAERAPALPVGLLRESIAREVVGMPLRVAARQVGLSPNGLRNFLDGASPRAATRMKLERWLATRSGDPGRPSVPDLVRLLDALGADLTPRQVRALSADVARAMMAAYQERRKPPPRWVRELVRRYDADRS